MENQSKCKCYPLENFNKVRTFYWLYNLINICNICTNVGLYIRAMIALDVLLFIVYATLRGVCNLKNIDGRESDNDEIVDGTVRIITIVIIPNIRIEIKSIVYTSKLLVIDVKSINVCFAILKLSINLTPRLILCDIQMQDRTALKTVNTKQVVKTI